MITILIPVNRLDRAKGRLASLLSESERSELAKATLGTVLDACAAHPSWRVVVVTADPEVARLAERHAEVIREDPVLRGLNPQLERAIALLPPDELVIVHADLPLFTREALESLLGTAGAPPSAVINPSGDGGTNTMYLPRSGAFALEYGPASAEKHRRGAEAAGIAVRFVHFPQLELDLDTPADLVKLLSTNTGRKTRAGRLLERMGVAARLAAPSQKPPAQ